MNRCHSGRQLCQNARPLEGPRTVPSICLRGTIRHLAAPREREVEKSILSGALPSPGTGPCTTTYLVQTCCIQSEQRTYSVLTYCMQSDPRGAGQLPDLSFPCRELGQTTSPSRAAVPTVDNPGSIPAPSSCGFCSLSESKFSPREARKSRCCSVESAEGPDSADVFCQRRARALILSYCSAVGLGMLFPTPRDTGDEILKGWLFMAWLLMDTTDAISWAPSEENSFLGWLKAL